MNLVRIGTRGLSTKVAVVGSGPAGFYTLYRLLQKNPSVKVDIFEKLPVPFGLSRYGVAPDHPEVKNCQDLFNQLGDNANFGFFGNVEIGKDLDLKQLKDNYNCVVFSYGCSDDNIGDLRNVQGIQSNGVITARQFVGWYNGLPHLQNLDPPLEKVEDVVIIGNGNVALDVTRALVQPVDIWRSTDMTELATKKLERSAVKNVKIVGRRGILESKFTNKELRELLELRDDGIFFNLINPEKLKDVSPLALQMGRMTKRRIDLIMKAMKNNADFDKSQIVKTWQLDYLKSPKEVVPSSSDPSILESVNFVHNELVQDSPVELPHIVHTNKFVNYKCELLILSTGYKGTGLPGFAELDIPFDPRTGTIGNINGRVVCGSNYEMYLKGFYSSGWISLGANGVINSTMMNGFQTAELILEDLDLYKDELKSGAEGVSEILKLNSVDYVSWDNWLKIEREEHERGMKRGKIREKVTDVKEMLEIAL